MIAHATYSDNRLCGFAGNHKLAVLIRHTAINQRRIAHIKQGYIGEIYGTVLAVNYATNHLSS